MTVTIENTYTGNGSTTDYSFTFPYLDTPDIKASLAGVSTTAYTLLNATTVRFNTAPGNGVAIRIYRETAYTNPKATFYPGSAIRAGDLNDNTLQNLYVTQEANDKVANAWLTGDPTVVSSESWYTTDDTKIASTKAIENRINSQIDSALTDDVVAGSSITIADNSPSSGKITVSVNASTTSASGSMSAADKSKLDGIESNATADQTNAEIRTAVEAATDSNVFTDADHSKLNAIEASATADQTDAEIRTAVENATDSNVFTDADHTKLNGIEASATADQTAAEIKTAYESNAQTNPLTDAEKAVIDGVTANTSELNKLDGVTATTTQLNIVSGKTFRASGDGTLSTTSDTEIPSSKVIATHVASAVSNVGGFVTIANEISFPTTANQPANGVIVSISDAAGTVINGSGVSTTGRTTDGTPATVTINNFPSSLNSETLASGVALLVTSTGSSNTYNYHKILAAETDVKSLSDDINDFNARYRVAGSAPGSNNDDGDLWFDTSANKMKVYNATGSSWDDVASVGQFFINTISSSSGTGGGSATFNGSAYRFTLSNPATGGAAQLLVSVNGVVQKPNTGTSQPSEGFAIDGNDIIFSTAPASGSDFYIITQGSSVSIGTPSANSVNSSHIIDGSIVNADVSNSANIAGSKVADDSIPEAKLDVHNAPATGKYLKYTSNGMEWSDGASEGTDVKSTGESGTAKFLRVDGDGTCSWAVPPDNNTVYTHPNHSGEVTSSADGAQTIASNVVDEDNLKVSNSPTNGQFLQAQSGNTGGLTWANVTIPPAGNTVDLVADGAIAAGKPVIIKSNGKAAQVGENIQARSTALKLNDVQVNTDSTKRYIHVLYDTANDRAVHISSSGDRLMAQCLNVNSSKEVYSKAGNNQEVHSNADHVSACWDSVNDRAIVAFRNTTNKHGYIVVGTFTNSSAMSWGTPVEFQDDVDGAFAGGSGTSSMHITHDPSADKCLLFYQLLRSSANGTFVGQARVITVASNGTVTVGSLHNITGTNQLYNFHCQNISSNFFAFSYNDGGNSHKPTLRTATLSGTNISFGSAVVASDEDTAGQGFGGGDADLAYDSVNQKLIFVHNAHLGSTAPICQARGRVASISGTSISFDAGEDNNIVSSSRRVYFIRLIYDVSTGTTWTCYISDHTQDSGYTKIMHIGQCTYDSSATYKLAYAGHDRQPNSLMDACHDLDQMQGPTIIGTSGQCLIPINDDGDTDSSYVITYDLNEAASNLTTHNPIGFAPSAISDGNTGTINCDGNTVTTSGLTAGTRYYVANDGTFQTSVGTTYAGGVALSSTKLLIKMST